MDSLFILLNFWILQDKFKGYTLPIAVAIVLSGQYEDDVDNSDEIVYTGQGGNDLLGNKRQIQDQVMRAGNLALKVHHLDHGSYFFFPKDYPAALTTGTLSLFLHYKRGFAMCLLLCIENRNQLWASMKSCSFVTMHPLSVLAVEV